MQSPDKTRILLVDDTQANRYVVARLLAHAGYDVTEVGTGTEALQALREHPEIVILDVKLPDMSGLEVAHLIKRNPETQNIPVLQLSATYTMTTDRIKGLDAGADAYLATPIDPEELLAHVRMLLRLKKAQDAQVKSNERLKAVLATIVDVFFSVDSQNWCIQDTNPAAARILEKPADRVENLVFWEAFPHLANTQFAVKLRDSGFSNVPQHFEAELPLLGSTWWEVHLYPRERKIDVYMRDISERKRSEERLQATARELQARVQELQSAQAELAQTQDRLREQNDELEARVRDRTAKLRDTITELETFSYSISHDMRAPLRAMQGFSKLLLETYEDQLDADGVGYLNRIANAANRLDLLIRDVLSYSTVVRAPLTLVPVDVNRLVHDIIHEYPGMQPPQARIRVLPPLPPALGNEAFLTQCFSNLLANAVKFVAPGTVPEVEVYSRKEDGLIRYCVRDNGIGIPKEHHKTLFSLFHRAQNRYPGTGIGLAVVRKAAERMGGRAGVESAPGKGSTFWVELREAPEKTTDE